MLYVKLLTMRMGEHRSNDFVYDNSGNNTGENTGDNSGDNYGDEDAEDG